MNKAKITFLAVGLISWALFTGSANSVANSGVGGKPANPRADNPRSESIFVHEIEPGGSVDDAVLVTNNTGEEISAEVYVVDSLVSSGGAFACEQKADEVNSTGTWIKLEKNKVELAGNSSEEIAFKISVPKDAPVGESNACIVIQAITKPEPSGVSGVELSFRSAIRVSITIPGEFEKQLTYESLNVIQKPNKLIANQVIKNSGNVSLDANLTTKLKTFFGLSINQSGGSYPVLASQSAEFNIELSRPFLGGFYIVDASAEYDSDKSTSLGESSQTKSTINTSKFVFVVPHPIAGILYILLLFAVIIPYIVRKKQKQKIEELKTKAISIKVKKGQDINKIAEIYQADWKQVAQLNQLKAPYSLEPKQELLVVPGVDYVAEKTKPTKTKKSAKTVKTKSKVSSKSKSKNTSKKTKAKKE